MKKETVCAKRNVQSGFTLIEMLLVVAIIGVLAAVVVVTFPGRERKAMIQATRGSIANVCTAIDVYETDTGRYPPSLQSLISNDGAPNWSGPYIRGGLPADAWGTPLTYTLKGESDFEVRSAGPDAQMGTGDDLTNPTNEGK
jgi:general secretion pathway protein G